MPDCRDPLKHSGFAWIDRYHPRAYIHDGWSQLYDCILGIVRRFCLAIWYACNDGRLGTAFYTTLVVAILGSVVLRILNNVYTSNVDHLVSYIASTAEIEIVPRLKQRSKSSREVAK